MTGNNNYSQSDSKTQTSITECFVILLIVIGTIFNSFVIYVFIKIYRRSKQLSDAIIISLTVSDLLPCISAYPIIAAKVLLQDSLNFRSYCNVEGFLVHLMAIASISHLSALAYESYYTVTHNGKRLQGRPCGQILTIFLLWMYSLVWSMMPLLGWSSYEVQGMQSICGIKWNSEKLSDNLYGVTLLFTNFLVPLAVIVSCYIELFSYVKQNRFLTRSIELTQISTQSESADNQCLQPQQEIPERNTNSAKKEKGYDKKKAVMVLIMTFGFIAAWSPYAVVSVVSLFSKGRLMTPVATTIASLFAKTAVIWNPIVYGFIHTKFRIEASQIFKRLLCT